jgi:hypothetical protein
VTDSTLSDNTAVIGGGISELGTVTVTDSTLSGNIGTQVGGGITVAGTEPGKGGSQEKVAARKRWQPGKGGSQEKPRCLDSGWS